MNIFSKIDQMINLTDSELVLVQFIKDNCKEFSTMNIKDVCNTCYISKPTIYRFCKKLEIVGFSDLKLMVASDYKDYIGESSLDYNFPIKANETQYDIIQNIKSIYNQTLTSTFNLVDLEQLHLSSQELKNAQYIDIYTSAGNLYFAENFKFQMAELGIHVNVPSEEYYQHLCASSSNESHVAIIISFGGRGRLIENLASILYKRKTPIILITSTGKNSLKFYTDRHLYMASYENHFHKISSFSTRLSLLYILDCLYASYFQIDYAKHLKRKLNIYKSARKK